jgi:hypothetical protein
MAPTVDYHCPCLSHSTVPPPPHLPSSSHSFHPLHSLFFCEECDAVRCNRCVSIEVSGYYCPNCLFEVPSASVRAEKNRSLRNSNGASLESYRVIFNPDALAIASCVPTVGILSRLCLRTLRTQAMEECQSQSAQSASLLFFCTATIAGGTLLKSA